MIKEKLKKMTFLRYLIHFPKDAITLVKYKKKIFKLEKLSLQKGKDLSIFKDRYKGKRCFVIGLGPSLTVGDLDLLKNEICFSSNRIYQLFDKTSWRPTFFCSGDPAFSEKIGEMLVSITENVKYVILNLAHVKNYDVRVRNRGNVYFYKTIVGTGFDAINKERGKFRERLDFTKEIDSIGTITYEIIEMALYMGFSEIILLGVDHFYGGGKHNYAGGFKPLTVDDKSQMGSIISTQRWTDGYKYIKELSEKEGIQIKNATRGGNLEVFERVDLDSIVKGGVS